MLPGGNNLNVNACVNEVVARVVVGVVQCHGPPRLSNQFSVGLEIDILPDDALLEIFAFYLQSDPDIKAWHTLIHVCRRWRSIVFASPRRLDLRIPFTRRTSMEEMFGVWPTIPIEITISAVGGMVTMIRGDSELTQDKLITPLLH